METKIRNCLAMYINYVWVDKIKSIEKFEMKFQAANAKGWHVIIGDNGSGKSTIIRSIALALIGPEEAYGLRANWHEWLSHGAKKGEVYLDIINEKFDSHTGKSSPLKNKPIPNHIWLEKIENNSLLGLQFQNVIELKSNFNSSQPHKINPARFNWGKGGGWFSVAYGPFRRFQGGGNEWSKVFHSQPKLGAHLSCFGEDVALTETEEWLKKLSYQKNEGKPEGVIIDGIMKLINSEDFLPYGVKIDEIDPDLILFKRGENDYLSLDDLSDGYRSILSLCFELIRQLIRVYGYELVFSNINNGELNINMPGIVLIDEIDAHLHPTWQVKIGQWFTKCFPNIQFIVTTHSPHICKGCIMEDGTKNGTIWLMARPGFEEKSRQLSDEEMNKLVFGNISDAYSTGAFGDDTQRSEISVQMLKELAKLNKLKLFGQISESDETRRLELEKIFTTDVTNDF